MRKTILAASVSPQLLATPYIGHLDAYANTLTGLIGQLYTALDVVSRELVGFIPTVARSTGVERAALGQSVTYDISPSMAAYDITPAMQIPEPPDFALGNGTMVLNKARAVPFGWTGEEELALNNGVGALTTQGNLFAQALRTLVNEIEGDIATEAALNASRAYGTAGTTPFASNLADTAQLRKILADNGAPVDSGMAMIMDTSAGANVRTLTNLTRVNEAGNSMTLRDGDLGMIHGFSLHESAAVVNFIKGTAAGATTNGTAYAVGATTITLAAAGTGTVKVGDYVTFAGDANRYLVVAGNASVAAGGTIQIALPGLRVAIPAAATAITLIGNSVRNVGFTQNALVLALRPPAEPNKGGGGDARIDSTLLTDPRSGATFEVSLWAGYRKIRAEVAAVWGVKATKREHIAALLG